MPRIDQHYQAEVRNCVIRICGISTSNESLPSGLIAASMIITMCMHSPISSQDKFQVPHYADRDRVRAGAERFTDPPTQAALEHVLVLTRELHAWPTEAAQSYVRCVWSG